MRGRVHNLDPMTAAKLRKLMLSFLGVEEVPHFDRRAFRTKRKIFATLGADDSVNLVIQPEDARSGLMESFPKAFLSLGGWTRLGYVKVALRHVDDELLRQVVTDAYQAALPKPASRSAAPRAGRARPRGGKE